MGTLGFERGVSTLANQVGYEGEFATVLALARRNGKAADPVLRQRLADMWIGLRLIRLNALRTMSTDSPGPEASIGKLQWASWHRRFGELAVDVAGADLDRPEHDDLRTIFLFSRADTIYGGSNQIQRNVIGERVLGLPKEPA
jgi:alkylation response protein AidB-like acyl-CoA dehydrogenase